MASYDSDSSGGEEEYTKTSVLLGYAAEEPTGEDVSHLGGEPTWLDAKTPPPGNFAKCKVCNSLLTLLLQLDGSLPEHFPGHERCLYIWSCRRKTCWRKEGSVRGIRGVRVNKIAAETQKRAASQAAKAEAEPRKPQVGLGDTLFGIGIKSSTSSAGHANPFANPFSTTTNGSANPFASASSLAAKPPQSTNVSRTDTSTLPETFASKVKISSPSSLPSVPAAFSKPPEPWPSKSAFPPSYPHYHLDAAHEELYESPVPVPQNVRMEVDSGEGAASGSAKEEKEAFESTLDRTFQKFADRLEHNPDQVLRYEFRGTPLLYNKTDAVGKALNASVEAANAKVKVSGGVTSGMPRCQNCGAERVFELQLTPHAITELEAEEPSLEGMEWGTIIMGVCSKDCAPNDCGDQQVGYLEEWIGVQWEELAKRTQ